MTETELMLGDYAKFWAVCIFIIIMVATLDDL